MEGAIPFPVIPTEGALCARYEMKSCWRLSGGTSSVWRVIARMLKTPRGVYVSSLPSLHTEGVPPLGRDSPSR